MKKNYLIFLLFCLAGLLSLESAAQTYNMSNSPVTTCSGSFYDNGGSGGNYSDNQGFTQTFTSADGNRIKFEFSSFDTWGNDLLRFYDGPNTSYPWLGNYSGTLSPFSIESTGDVITVVFVPSNTNTSKAGWAATISCTTSPLPNYDMNSGTVTACEGVFYDGGGPTGNYSAGEDKTVTFCSGTTDFLRFTFTRIDAATVFETGDSLFIYDGADVNASPIAVYVQGSKFEEFTSTGTCVTFRFASDGTSEAVGWQALFSCTSTPGTVQTYRMAKGVHYTCSGTLTDDGGSGNYSDNSNNTQVFRSADGNRIKVDFTSFDTWGNDVLKIYDGPNTSYPWLGNYSGTLSDFSIESTGDALTFVFTPSNTNTSKAGWSADISCTTPVLTRYDMNSGTVTACEGAFYDSGGHLADYSAGEDKTVTFCSGTSDFLQFTFSRTEAATQLGAGDSLFVYDGPSTSSSPLAVYVQGSRFESFTSSGTCVSFRFKSDGSGESTGWQAIFECTSTPGAATTYRIGKGVYYTCSGTFVDDAGSGNYDDYVDYNSQTFVSYSGCGIRFTFSQFDTWSGDVLTAYDGPNTSSPLIGNYSGTIADLIIQSSGNAVTFVWNTNSNGATKPGFNATITCPNVTAPPTPGANTPVCAGDDLNLTASNVPGASYSWTGPDGFTSTDQNPTINSVTTAKAGTYSVTAIVGTCASTTETINVTVETAPATPAVSSNSPVCTGNAINLTCETVSGGTYSWAGPDGFTSSDQNPSIASATTDAAGTYTVTVTKGSCTVVNSTSVTVNPSPGNVTASSNSPVCAGTTLDLTASSAGATSYSWSGPNSFASTDQNPSIASATTAASGTYTVTASIGGCSKQNTVNVTVSDAPTVPTAGSNGPVCAGEDLNLTAVTIAGASYSWSGPNSFSSTSQNPSISEATTAASGTYTVTASIGSCSEQSTVNVTVNPSPAEPTASNNGPLCEGENLNLMAATVSGASYSWSGPNSFSSTSQNPSISNATTAASGTYTVTATIGTCSNESTTNVIVSAVPSASAGGNSPLCEGSTLNLTANTVAGATYSWSGPNSFSSSDEDPSIASVTAADAGTYTLTISIGTCSDQDDITITVNPTPAAPVAGSNSPVCEGEDINLTASTVAGASYSWTGPNSFSSTDQNPTRSAVVLADAGTYTVRAIENGCQSAPATVNVSVSSVSAATAGNDGPYCEGDDITLTVTTVSGASYSWSGPNGFSSTDQSPVISDATTADAGNYTVTVTVGSCSSQSSTNVTVNAAPAVPTISFDGVFTLTSSAASGNQWYMNGTELFGQDAQTCMIFGNGVYTVEVTDVNGCSSVSAPFNHGVTSTGNKVMSGNISVYPNPSEGHFRISGENLNAENLQMRILNVYGMEVSAENYELKGSSLNAELDLSNLEKGVYFLHLDDGFAERVVKIVIQ